MREFAKKHHIPFDICGKIIVAANEREIPHLTKIFDTGIENGTEGIELIDAQQIKDIEPYCKGIQGIWVPCAGIINYKAVAQKYADLFQAANGKVFLQQEVINTQKEGPYNLLQIKDGATIKSKYVIYCGGSQSDRLAKGDGQNPGMKIVAFRGEYYELVNKEKVRNLIYPVPNPNFPFLGVHFTRMIDGSVECGPNAVFAFKREGYLKTDFSWKDTKESVTYIGFWKLVTKHLGYGIKEQWRSISKRAFLKSLQQLIPSLTMEDIEPGRAGVRALALAPNGAMIDDFKIINNAHSIHVLNAPSPAATASMAIGKSIMELAVQRFGL